MFVKRRSLVLTITPLSLIGVSCNQGGDNSSETNSKQNGNSNQEQLNGSSRNFHHGKFTTLDEKFQENEIFFVGFQCDLPTSGNTGNSQSTIRWYDSRQKGRNEQQPQGIFLSKADTFYQSEDSNIKLQIKGDTLTFKNYYGIETYGSYDPISNEKGSITFDPSTPEGITSESIDKDLKAICLQERELTETELKAFKLISAPAEAGTEGSTGLAGS